MLRRLYDWVIGLAGDARAEWWLAAVAFVEASVFPIPPDLMLIPMVLAARQRAWRYAAICTLASVAGGWLGYAIGDLLYQAVGARIVAFYHLQAGFASFQAGFREWGAWIILAKGATPIPFKIVTIAAGVAGLPLLPFTLAALVSRAVRFFLVAALLWRFGPVVRDFVERRLALVTTAFLVLLVGGFVALRWL